MRACRTFPPETYSDRIQFQVCGAGDNILIWRLRRCSATFAEIRYPISPPALLRDTKSGIRYRCTNLIIRPAILTFVQQYAVIGRKSK